MWRSGLSGWAWSVQAASRRISNEEVDGTKVTHGGSRSLHIGVPGRRIGRGNIRTGRGGRRRFLWRDGPQPEIGEDVVAGRTCGGERGAGCLVRRLRRRRLTGPCFAVSLRLIGPGFAVSSLCCRLRLRILHQSRLHGSDREAVLLTEKIVLCVGECGGEVRGRVGISIAVYLPVEVRLVGAPILHLRESRNSHGHGPCGAIPTIGLM